jgi:hypothetical protein
MIFPSFRVIFKWGSMLEKSPEKSDSKPLKTDKTTIRAIVPIATPIAEIPEITLMALCDFLEKR